MIDVIHGIRAIFGHLDSRGLSIFTTLITLAILAQSADLEEGSELYLARIGENAVLQRNPKIGDTVRESYGGFTDVANLVAFDAARSKLVEANLGNRAKLTEVISKLKADYREAKKIVSLKHLTPVEILGYATLSASTEKLMRPRKNTIYIPYPDTYLVLVKEGPLKGKIVWVSRFDVIVPGAKPPRMPKLIGEPQSDGGEPEEPNNRPREFRSVDRPLALVDTTWGPHFTDDYMRVQGRVRNTSDKSIKRLKVTVDIEDVRDKLVKSEWTYVEPETLEPGDVGNFSVLTKKEDAFDHYGIRFEAGGRNVEYSRPR